MPITPKSKPAPKPPKHLKAAGKAIWAATVAALDAAGTLSADTDLALIEGITISLLRAREADAEISKYGLTQKLTSNSGNVYYQPHPAVAISATAWKQVKAFADSLGLSPSGRAKLREASGFDAKAELDALMSDDSGEETE
jgi:P27 family predicted phage terminase small subunit